MKRDAEARLIDFCVRQHTYFNATDWEEFTAVTSAELATVARFLAGVAWYGHQTELRRFADGLTSMNFSDLARETHFGPSRFAALFKMHLERRPVAAA